MGQHDLSYRLFFSHRRMIQDLLREIVGERWVEHIDFESGEIVDTTFISPRHEKRESDLIWRFWRKDGTEPVFVYLLIQLQPQPDPSIPDRLLSYIGKLYQRLMVNRPRKLWQRKMPLVIPVVAYGEERTWDPREEITLEHPVAELFRFQRNRSWWEIRLSPHRLRQRIPTDEATLERAFETWLAKVVRPSLSEEEAFETPPTLEEIEIVLAKNFDPELRGGRQEAAAQLPKHLDEIFKD